MKIMDNKKWSKRFSTIFWWSFAILPFIFILIYFIGYHLTFNSGISTASELADYHANSYGSISYAVSQTASTFSNFTPSFLVNAWSGLFTYFSLGNDFDPYSVILAYMSFTFIIHVIFDIIVWLPKWLHCAIDKYEV